MTPKEIAPGSEIRPSFHHSHGSAGFELDASGGYVGYSGGISARVMCLVGTHLCVLLG